MNHTDNHNKAYINADGQKVMRVSEVIKRLSKSQIAAWANRLGLKGIAYNDELNRTANIGSLAHDVIEHYITPKKLAMVDYESYGITARQDIIEANRMIRSLLKWYKKFQHPFKVLHTEFVVIGKTLGGTIDCVIEDWSDPSKVIFVDWKSSGFYLTQFLQLCGYVLIYEELYGEGSVGGVMVVAADKKHGDRAKAKLLRRRDMKLCLKMFRSLFETAYYEDILERHFYQLLENL